MRTAQPALAAVDAALGEGRIVRSWPMRGTLHLTTAEDLGWMLALTRDGIHRATRRRHEALGLTARLYDRAAQSCEKLLRSRGMTRTQLVAAWREDGIDTSSQLTAHLIGRLCRDGVLVLGPMAGRDQELRLTSEWIPRPRRLDGDDAVREWAGRYFSSHGPATVADFCWWTKLPIRVARAGLADLGDDLTSVPAPADGAELWCARSPGPLRGPAPARGFPAAHACVRRDPAGVRRPQRDPACRVRRPRDAGRQRDVHAGGAAPGHRCRHLATADSQRSTARRHRLRRARLARGASADPAVAALADLSGPHSANPIATRRWKTSVASRNTRSNSPKILRSVAAG